MEDGEWVINGRKWFTSGAARAAYTTVMVRTEPDTPGHGAFSMIIVPTDNPGYKIVRELMKASAKECSYIVHNHVYAHRMQDVFSRVGRTDLLLNCVGMNRLWLQTGPENASWNRACKTNSFKLRQNLYEYCETRTKEIINSYEKFFYKELTAIFRRKLGLMVEQSDDLKLIEELLSWMQKNKKDYTLTFRDFAKDQDSLFEDDEGKSWHEKYQHRLSFEKTSSEDRLKIMTLANPKFVLRNYLAQEAIQDAEKSDFTKLKNLLKVLKNPYDENSEFENFANAPPEWGKKLEISCSS